MPKTKTVPVDDADAYSIEEFCLRNRIGVGMFYKYPDIMPDSFLVGTRRLISREAAARWRREREIATAEAAAAGSPQSAPPAPGHKGSGEPK